MRAVLHRHFGEATADRAAFPVGQHQSINKIARIAGEAEVDTAQRRHCPARPEQAERRAVADLAVIDEIGHRFGRARAHRSISSAADIRIGIAMRFGFGHRDDAPRDARPVNNAQVIAFGLDTHELGRAATDVENQRGAIAGFEHQMAPPRRKPRFLAGVNNVEENAGFAIDTRDEIGAVFGAAARFGRDRAREVHAAPHQLVRTDFERGDGAFNGRITDPPARAEPLTKAHDPRKSVDHGKAVARPGSRNQQAAIVGAQVQRGIGSAIGPARSARLGCWVGRHHALSITAG